MAKMFARILLAAFLILLFPLVSIADDEPSEGAKGMAGALGTFEFKPADWKEGETTWWKDTDGVDPGTAGCHIGTDKSGKPNGRSFGEACTSDGKLVESNPGAGVLHEHDNDIGHPDKFDCNVWCKAKGKSKGKSKGMCMAAPAPPCDQGAICSCS